MPKAAPAQRLPERKGQGPIPPERSSMIRGSVGLRGAPTITPPFNGAIARVFLAGRTLATRLVVAGALLVAGLPVLTILVYVWGYPSSPVPIPLVVLVDGLQVMIVLYAVVIVAQFVAGTGIRVSWVSGRHNQMADAREAPLPVRRRGPVGLRELSLRLAEMIWEQERNRRAVLGPAILDYVRDAVTAELEHRRTRDALEQRLARLELLLTGVSGAEASDHDRC